MRRYLSLALVLVIAACEGPVGPDGPPGPPGTPGPAGLTGPQGNANVAEFTFAFSDNNVQFEDNIARFAVSIDELTEEVETSGAVLAFVQFGNNGRWVGLPLTEGVDTNGDGNVDFNWEYTYNYGVGLFELKIRATGRRVAGINAGMVKVVLVAGDLSKKGLDLNFQSYEEAAAFLGLEL